MKPLFATNDTKTELNKGTSSLEIPAKKYYVALGGPVILFNN
jgi:hypothetical protein